MYGDTCDKGQRKILKPQVRLFFFFYALQVSDLLGEFRFVPTWRVDDVMVSYAPEGGSVGPHVDNYDVFLLQVTVTLDSI